ncbi:MAG TPA: hypothetical protein GX510_01965 [Firmicutes bacterium]|nr:hypothetical protein [Candidatus Fermentithermobacillaceae bacterium]
MKRTRIIAAGWLVAAFVGHSVLAILQNQELRDKDREITELTRANGDSGLCCGPAAWSDAN